MNKVTLNTDLFMIKFTFWQDCVSDQDEEPGKHGLELESSGWQKVEKEIVMKNHNVVQYPKIKTHENFVK